MTNFVVFSFLLISTLILRKFIICETVAKVITVSEVSFTSVRIKTNSGLAKIDENSLICQLQVKVWTQDWSEADFLDIICGEEDDILLDNLLPDTHYHLRIVMKSLVEDYQDESATYDVHTLRRPGRPPGGGGGGVYPPIIRPPHGQGNSTNSGNILKPLFNFVNLFLIIKYLL